jgi:hypothetical protein
LNSDSFIKSKRQHLKRRLLQYQWLTDKGFNCSAQLEELKKDIEKEGFSFEEIEREEVQWAAYGKLRYLEDE